MKTLEKSRELSVIQALGPSEKFSMDKIKFKIENDNEDMDVMEKMYMVTFGPIPDIEYYDRGTVTVIENNCIILENDVEVYSDMDKETDIYDGRVKSDVISLEECVMVNGNLECSFWIDSN
jgi:hypothetical protein